VRLSTSNKKFKSFKSTYKNASSITFDHASAGRNNNDSSTLVRATRNWQKDRDIYGSDIMNASTMPAQSATSRARIFSPK
jgi:hypothetical protein